MIDIIDSPSPHFNDRPWDMEPTLIVVHGTAGTDEGDLDWLTNPAVPVGRRVSYHYLVQRDGTTHRLVDETKRAWHAGESEWQNREGCNDYSIGIGLSNLGPGSAEVFSPQQYASCAALIVQACRRWPALSWERVVGHHQVSPGRKPDPWYYFEWGSLFAAIRRWEGW